jgi:glycosyltransferase involved in cell wall biosynthesis/peptidoglycan/xylan/chitin deacetylase (PgdA/CDA1 family)
MKIWHVGASPSPFRVDGVSRTVWLLSREQARLGHDVSLILDDPPDQAAKDIAAESGLKLIDVNASHLTYSAQAAALVAREQPQIVHMHSVFVPRQATLGKLLSKAGIPYVITPHGGLAPQVLRRGVVKKSVYAFLRERPRFLSSSAVLLVTPAEERAVRSFIPNYSKPVRWMPNPVEVEKLDPHRWQGVQKHRRLVYLGRFDVLVKGIDILVEIARLLPDMQVDLYGTEDPKTLDWLNQIKQNLPANVTFHDPIFGLDKAQMLSEASLYLQPSRWEGFPVSVAECLYLGVPSAIADTLDLAQLFYQHALGLVLPLDPPRAATQIRTAVEDEDRLRQWSKRGREFALEHFHPTAVANKHIALYEQVVKANTRAETQAVSTRNGHSRRLGLSLFSAPMRGSIKSSVSRMFERTGHLLGGNGAPRTVVLCYHSIHGGDGDLSIAPEAFRSQLRTLQHMRYRFMSFAELVQWIIRWGPPRENIACITFDDGYSDNLTEAAPILKDLSVPATFFLTTGLMTREPSVISYFKGLTRFETEYLSPQQVAELHRMGFEIGAHTHTHRNLARLSSEQARDEIVRSKALLEDVIGAAVSSFAYPFGKRNIHYTQQTVARVRESGYSGAGAVAFRSVTSRRGIRIFEVPRFFVTRGDSPRDFRQKIAGHFDWLGSVQEGTPTWIKALVSPEDKY